MVKSHKRHFYHVHVKWSGNTGQGTASYKSYERAHEIIVEGKPLIFGSSDPAFRGDKTKYNPEELLVASLSTCHMLVYLHLCADSQITVIEYTDNPVGTMVETEDGGGRFNEVVLKPVIKVTNGSNTTIAEQLHTKAHHLCFIANSVSFPVRCEPLIQVACD